MMKTIEEYHNIVVLLQEALKFYANKENYIEKPMNDGLISMIELDDGTQARFALNKLRGFLDESDEQEKEFVDNLKKAIEANESYDTMIELINVYKTQQEKNEDV